MAPDDDDASTFKVLAAHAEALQRLSERMPALERTGDNTIVAIVNVTARDGIAWMKFLAVSNVDPKAVDATQVLDDGSYVAALVDRAEAIEYLTLLGEVEAATTLRQRMCGIPILVVTGTALGVLGRSEAPTHLGAVLHALAATEHAESAVHLANQAVSSSQVSQRRTQQFLFLALFCIAVSFVFQLLQCRAREAEHARYVQLRGRVEAACNAARARFAANRHTDGDLAVAASELEWRSLCDDRLREVLNVPPTKRSGVNEHEPHR